MEVLMETSNAQLIARGSILKPMIGPLLIFLLALYFYILAGGIDVNPMPGQLGPAFWPKALLILLMISCGIKALEIYRAPSEEAAKKTSSSADLRRSRASSAARSCRSSRGMRSSTWSRS
jgi:hypothetical protein